MAIARAFATAGSPRRSVVFVWHSAEEGGLMGSRYNLDEEANASLRKPLALNYDMNDAADFESLYTRSDHYSYASKGVPVIFFTTGLHLDYAYVTDEVDKILFDKVRRVEQLAYSTTWQLANLDHLPARDCRGPRMGKGRTGRL